MSKKVLLVTTIATTFLLLSLWFSNVVGIGIWGMVLLYSLYIEQKE